MSFGILQTFLNRLHTQGSIEKLPLMETMHRQFEVEDEKYRQVTKEIIEEERPPIVEIEAYREKHKGP